MALIDRALEGLGDARPDLRARLEVRRAAEDAHVGQASVAAVRDAVERARAVGDPLVLAESLPVGTFALVDGVWRLQYGNVTVEVSDSIGMQRLAQLLARPFVDMPVADLVGGLESTSRHELIDATAMRAYRDRIGDLCAEIDEADEHHDIVRAERLREDLETLLEHISASAGLGQRSRLFTTSQERARVAVRKSLSRAFDEIAIQSPRVAEQLTHCIRTGLVCRFEPQDQLPALWTRSDQRDPGRVR